MSDFGEERKAYFVVQYYNTFRIFTGCVSVSNITEMVKYNHIFFLQQFSKMSKSMALLSDILSFFDYLLFVKSKV